MIDNYIHFKKQRDLGEVISDTFKFLRGNYKLLFQLIVKIAGPAFVILALVLAYYSHMSLESFGNPFSAEFDGKLGQLFASVLMMLLALLAFYIMLSGTVLHFIKSYIAHNGTVLESEVFEGVKRDFGKLLGLFILTGLMVFAGLLLCILPGIYLWVPLSLAIPALIFNQLSISDSINESFKLIKDNWWITFLTLFIIVLLVNLIGFIFQIPMIIYFIFKSLTVVQEGSVGDPSSMFDWVYVVLNVIASLASYLLSIIFIISSAFIFYHLKEKKNFTGSYETISNLGAPEDK